jgi:hypothetical protein
MVYYWGMTNLEFLESAFGPINSAAKAMYDRGILCFPLEDKRTIAEKNLQAVTDWLEGKINDEELKERIEV